MELIPCARGCVYQTEGCCELNSIYGGGMGDSDCCYFIPRGKSVAEKPAAGLKDGLDADKLKGSGKSFGK